MENSKNKFRAWTDKKIMITPVCWINESNHFIGEDFTNNEYGNVIDIMQFTGLYDKNGQDIYEGDILNPVCINGSIGHGKVLFDDGCFIVQHLFGEKWAQNLNLHINHYKIIGNIHENPELLK